MDYGLIIDEMEWSYSRLASFDDCPYGWLLKYIKRVNRDDPGPPHFFATYGTFMHEILEKYLSGEMKREELVPYFLDNYDECVVGETPSEKVRSGFFQKALSYLENIEFPFDDVIDTEKEVRFVLGGYRFVGYIDVLARKGKGLHIIDHKSHGLRPRSGRRYQTEYDKELDRYLRQQYLYAIPIKEETGNYPKTISFNCYRHDRFITEKFDPEALHNTKMWALGKIEEIKQERDWEAKPDDFRCKYICDVAHHCEHCKLCSKRR